MSVIELNDKARTLFEYVWNAKVSGHKEEMFKWFQAGYFRGRADVSSDAKKNPPSINTYVAENIHIINYGLVTAITRAETADEAWKKIIEYVRDMYGDSYAFDYTAFGNVYQMGNDDLFAYVEDRFKRKKRMEGENNDK